jgi:subtilisin-like proprotein convertase family protein
MKTNPRFRGRVLIPAMFVLTAAGTYVAFRWTPASPPRQAPEVAKGAGKRTEPTRIVGTRGARPVESTYQIHDGGTLKSFDLALDEVALKMPNGRSEIRKIEPPAMRENYVARLGEFAGQGEVQPVLYPEGEERDAFNRRLVTSKVLVEAEDGTDRESLPASFRLPVEMMPHASPKHTVLKATSPLAALDGLAGWSGLAGVKSVDVLLAKQQAKRAMPNDPLIAKQWHLKYQGQSGAVPGTDVNVEPAWNYPSATAGTFVRGSGVRIGIVDDGLQTAHPDLAPNVDTLTDKDWNQNDNDPNPDPANDSSDYPDDHGTACAGNAAAKGNNNLGVSGTAPDATLVGLRLISGDTDDAMEADAMSYLMNSSSVSANDVIHIKSNSWGPNDDGRTLEAPGTLTTAALANATANGRGGKGTIFLWAGGNGGDEGDNSNYDGYANSIHTIAIGAMNSLGNRSYYSEAGANLIVVAPSNGQLGITTVDRTGSKGYNSASTANGGDYCNDFGGTSSATPTAAGIVALMLQRNPNLGWRDVQEILIRGAKKIKSSDSGWANNAAGFHFHHDFGAGLIDAAAAVELAGTWTNLGTQISQKVSQAGLGVSIPNNNASGVTRSFAISQNIRAEQVTVKVNISHPYRGNLAITLTSPSGMQSRLSEMHTDPGSNYSNWTFMTTRAWGESATGTWTLKVADVSNSNNSVGTLNSAELTVFGSEGTPVNPAPVVQITDPVNGTIFSPGSAVQVSVTATDTVIGGGAGIVQSVQLLDNGTVVGTKNAAPYVFSIAPSLGSHSLVARATDSEGASADSATVSISLANSAPVITAATVGGAIAYADEPLTVTGISASDPDGGTPTISYQWQSSTDGIAYTNVAGLTSATLSADSERAGKKWRCALTASDGSLSSNVFHTSAVNLVFRPVTTAAAGTAYSYQSGLVLASGGGAVSRDAIIHEFSQGPSGSNSEWVELLTLRAAGFRNWTLKDSSGSTVRFADAAIWDSIPAGTRIVIYNHDSKDPLLPEDDSDPTDHRLVLPSNHAAFFSTNVWPSLSNNGDGIHLANASGTIISEVGYGNDPTVPNVGAVSGGRSAYYGGNTDEGASLAAGWKVTTSLSARSGRLPKALLPGVVLAGGNYVQNFDVTPGAAGTAYPDGWTSYNGGSEDTVMSAGTQSSTSGANYNYGSKIGLLGSGSAFDPASLVLAIQNTSGLNGLTISFDAIKIREGARSMQLRLEYSLTSPTTGFTTVPGGTYLSGELPEGTVTSFSGISLAAISNQSSTVYLRWLYEPAPGSPGGTRDGIALDNVSISTGSSSPALTLTIAPPVFAENGGPNAATGTVSIPSALASDLVVGLATTDAISISLPSTVTILAGQPNATFSIGAVDNTDADGSRSAVLTASASGHAPATATITVTDDEAPLKGVTPGSGNTPLNTTWIASLMAGTAGNPAHFRLGAAGSLPDGLTLDPLTGLISGTISPLVSGEFVIVIERFNGAETVSQSFTLEVTGGTIATYATWIASFPEISNAAPLADPDGDGLSNLLEYFLGLNPDTRETGALVAGKTGDAFSLTYPRSRMTTGLSAQVEWSSTLENGSWTTEGLTHEVLSETTASQIIRTSLAVDSGFPRVFLRIRVTGS